MIPQEQDALPGGLASPATGLASANPLINVSRFAKKTFVVAELEVRKIYHDPTEIILRGVQPMLWLLVFGQVFTRSRAIPTGNLSYLDFMTPGILAQSVLFIAIFYGVAIIWERDLGIIHKLLASPTPRSALVLGKALSAGVRSFLQVFIIYSLALLLGVKMSWNPLSLLGVLAVVVMSAALFSTFSLIIACLVKTRERFMGVGQLMTMPLFFASNAIYPISMMPPWLQVLAKINPLTYEVDALRFLMLANRPTGSLSMLILDFAVLLMSTALLVVIGGRLYPNAAT
ncbi:MAG: ABC transporter permease [bacterium]